MLIHVVGTPLWSLYLSAKIQTLLLRPFPSHLLLFKLQDVVTQNPTASIPRAVTEKTVLITVLLDSIR